MFEIGQRFQVRVACVRIIKRHENDVAEIFISNAAAEPSWCPSTLDWRSQATSHAAVEVLKVKMAPAAEAIDCRKCLSLAVTAVRHDGERNAHHCRRKQQRTQAELKPKAHGQSRLATRWLATRRLAYAGQVAYARGSRQGKCRGICRAETWRDWSRMSDDPAVARLYQSRVDCTSTPPPVVWPKGQGDDQRLPGPEVQST